MTQFDELAAPELIRQRAAGREGARADTPLAPGPASLLRLQRSAGNAAVVARLAEDDADRPIKQVVAGGGRPLDRVTRHGMERAFGHDFSDVRIHDDTAASAAAQDVSARAATVGSHIVFRSGEFDPTTPGGQHLLAHELTHVVQQRSGPVDGASAGGGVKISDPSDSFERAAEANASHITSKLDAGTTAPGQPGGAVAGGGSVQREESAEAEDEEPVQGYRDPSVQREESAEAEDEEPVQGYRDPSVQREESDESEAEE